MVARTARVLVATVLALAGCTSGAPKDVHDDFLPNLAKHLSASDGSFESRVVSMRYDEPSRTLAIGRESGVLEIWDTRSPRAMRELNAHDHRIGWIAFTAGTAAVLTGSDFDHNVKLWDIGTGALLHMIPQARGPFAKVPGQDQYVIQGGNSRMRIFDLARKILLPGEYEPSGVVVAMAWDDNSRRLAVGTASGSIDVWRYTMTDGRPRLEQSVSAKPYATGDWVVGLRFSPDGTRLYSLNRSGAVDEWVSDTLSHVRSISSKLRFVHSVAFDRDGKYLGVGGASDAGGLSGASFAWISLASGESTTSPSNTTLSVVEFLPPRAVFVSAQHRKLEVHAPAM
jgi:WD40 repeat protein